MQKLTRQEKHAILNERVAELKQVHPNHSRSYLLSIAKTELQQLNKKEA